VEVAIDLVFTATPPPLHGRPELARGLSAAVRPRPSPLARGLSAAVRPRPSPHPPGPPARTRPAAMEEVAEQVDAESDGEAIDGEALPKPAVVGPTKSAVVAGIRSVKGGFTNEELLIHTVRESGTDFWPLRTGSDLTMSKIVLGRTGHKAWTGSKVTKEIGSRILQRRLCAAPAEVLDDVDAEEESSPAKKARWAMRHSPEMPRIFSVDMPVEPDSTRVHTIRVLNNMKCIHMELNAHNIDWLVHYVGVELRAREAPEAAGPAAFEAADGEA